MNPGLGDYQFSDSLVIEQGAHLSFIGPLDNEIAVEITMPDLDVLHAKPFGDIAEKAAPINRETKMVRVHIWCPHSREDHRRFACRDRVGIQRYRPFTMLRLHFTAAPETSFHE